MCEVWCVKSKLWTVKNELWTVTSKLWCLKSEQWTVNYAVWSLKCELWSVNWEVWRVKSELWSVKFEAWSLNCELKRPLDPAVSAPDLGSRDLGFESCWRWDSALTITALHCTEHFMFTLPLFWYDWNTVEKDVKPQIIHPWIVNFEMALSADFYT